MAYTFTRAERLRSGDFRKRQWIRGAETSHFLHLRQGNQQGVARIAVVVRKKLGGAVTRNRMRRLVKEFFRLHKDLFADGSDNLIRVKKVPQDLTLSSASRELTILLTSVNSR